MFKREDVITMAKEELRGQSTASSPFTDVSSLMESVRSILNDTKGTAENPITPRWSDDFILASVKLAVHEVTKIRKDTVAADASSITPGSIVPLNPDYHLALVHFAVAKCFELDADKKGGNYDLLEYHMKRFVDLVALAPFRWDDSYFPIWCEAGLKMLLTNRPDLKIDIRKRIKDFDSSIAEIDLDDKWMNAIKLQIIYRARVFAGQTKEAKTALSLYEMEVYS